MTIRVPFKQRVPQIEINLCGPKGNVFYLIQLAKQLSSKLGLNWDIIYKRMTMHDYVHAVKTFEAYFGDYVTLDVSEELLEQLENY
ncbi:hypothetical protein OKZ62_001746 [Vibrio navarrensis]|nr:hypothetical protein [Vibrio navarrensis]